MWTSWRAGRWTGPLLCVAAGTALFAWTWGKWADVVIDFGRELYVPWQMSEGKALYADIAYFNGPLSPTFNAALFTVAGTSVRTLVVANLAILTAVAVMIHDLLRHLGGRFAAATGTLTFLVFFAFEAMPGGNYNFVAPYSHEMTHGSALALGALSLLGAYLRHGGRTLVFALGAVLGLVLLTKSEFLIAVLPAVAGGLALHHWIRGTTARDAAAIAGSFLAGALAPPAIAFGAFLTQRPAGEAARAVLGSWAHLFNRELWELAFYKEIMGTDDLRGSLGRAGAWALRYAVVLAPAAAAGFLPRPERRLSLFVSGLLGLAAAGIVLAGRHDRDWEHLASPFPLLLAGGLAAMVVALARTPRGAPHQWRLILGLVCLTHAVLLLAKMFFNVRLLHYGFALAMPAGVASTAMLAAVVPAWLDRRGRHGAAFRAAVVGAIVAFGAVHAVATAPWLARRTVPFGRGADRLYGERRDQAFADLLATLERVRRPGDTLAVMPEGVMLNYLTRMENPTPYVNFMPPELIVFTEERMVSAFAARPPALVVLINRSATEYGFRFLGDDYGRRLVAWVEANYEVTSRIVERDALGRPLPYAAILRLTAGATGDSAGHP